MLMSRLSRKVPFSIQQELPQVVQVVEREKTEVAFPAMIEEIFKAYDEYHRDKPYWERIDLATTNEINAIVAREGFDPSDYATIHLVEEIRSLWQSVYNINNTNDIDPSVLADIYSFERDMLSIDKRAGGGLKFVKPLNRALFYVATLGIGLNETNEVILDEIARIRMPGLARSSNAPNYPAKDITLHIKLAHESAQKTLALAKYISNN